MGFPGVLFLKPIPTYGLARNMNSGRASYNEPGTFQAELKHMPYTESESSSETFPPDDFLCFDANEGTMWVEAEEIEGKPRDLGVSWLKGRYHDGYLWVRYDDGKRARRRFLG
jgi:hypothetical protein